MRSPPLCSSHGHAAGGKYAIRHNNMLFITQKGLHSLFSELLLNTHSTWHFVTAGFSLLFWGNQLCNSFRADGIEVGPVLLFSVLPG